MWAQTAEHGLTVLMSLALMAAATGLGRLMLHLARTPLQSRGEALAFGAGIGLGTLSLIIFALACLQQLNPLAIGAAMGAAAVAGLVGWFIPLAPVPARPLPLVEKLSALLLVPLLGACLAGVLTPAVGTDELTYHLAVPQAYLRHGGFHFIPGNLFSNYPLAMEMLYIPALVLQGDALAKAIHFATGWLILAAMAAFCRRHLPGSSFVWLGLVIFAGLPSVFVNARMAYNDLAFTLFCLLAVFAFANWADERRDRWLVWCAVFSGLAMSVKYAGLLLPLLGIIAIGRVGRTKGYTATVIATQILVFLVMAAVVGAPFYLKNALLTGNPIYPFAHEVFGGLGWDATQARRYGIFLHGLGMGRDFYDHLLLPWNLSIHAQMNSPRFDGVIGPLFVLVLPFALAARPFPPALRTALWFCLSYFVFWALTAQQIRYLFPIFPFLAVATGFVLHRVQAKPVLFWLALNLVTGSLIVNGHHIVKDLTILAPLDYLRGREDRHGFVARHVPAYPLYRFANENLPEKSHLYLIYMRNLGFLCRRPFYSDSILESHTLEQVLSGAGDDPDRVRETLSGRGFTHLMVDAHFLLGPSSPLSAAHRQLFTAFADRHLQQLAVWQGRYFLWGWR